MIVVRSMLGVGTGLLLTGSVFALLYGYLVRYFAVAYQTVEAGLARITPAMDASARSLGSTPFDTFIRVPLADTATVGAGRVPARFRRCDEGVTGNIGAAAIQFRHACGDYLSNGKR